MQLPESMDNLAYFTRRVLEPEGKIVCWVEREKCPKCKQAMMGKPRDPKTNKPQIRATEYVCPACKYTEEKEAYEGKLTAKAMYTCPYCKKQGESTTIYKRKTIKGAPTLRFLCQHCQGNLDVTKKFKEQKK
ncbi:MAG: hypothetical protein ABIA93_02195 [Candidatus Woesearchaeota archaeon]